MKCPKCGKENNGYSAITGKFTTCGHRNPEFTDEMIKERKKILQEVNNIMRQV